MITINYCSFVQFSSFWDEEDDVGRYSAFVSNALHDTESTGVDIRDLKQRLTAVIEKEIVEIDSK